MNPMGLSNEHQSSEALPIYPTPSGESVRGLMPSAFVLTSQKDSTIGTQQKQDEPKRARNWKRRRKPWDNLKAVEPVHYSTLL
jgi:hypothetical protein